MQVKFAELAKSMEAARNTPSLTGNASAMQSQLTQIERLRNGYTEVTKEAGKTITTVNPGFNQLMQATGGWNVQTVKAVSSSQQLTKSLMDGKLQVGQLTQGWKQFKQTLNEVANQQQALRNATAVQWTASGGKSMVDLYTPTEAVASANTKIGTYLTALKAAGQGVQDWGKNTQWAGRQITAGFVMPVALASAGLVALATAANTQLTRITKVMNTAQVSNDPFVQQQSNIQQYAQTRNEAMQTGIDMAKQYGAALTDTLGLEADLAALGKSGADLQTTTAQVTRFATLGELDYNTALQTTISLMNAYKMSASGLGDAFNYMNALENNTSLSMSDFAKAIPIASNAMAQLGVSFKDFGTLLVAGKAGGVDATQMANSLKSSTGRILTPTKSTQAAFEALTQADGKGIDINKIVSSSGGNLMSLLQMLGPMMDGQDPLKRMTAIKGLFGTYQYGKQSTVISNLLDAQAHPYDPKNPGAASQTATAIYTANQSNDANKQIADQEVKQFQDSASGKLKIATATMKAQLTELGGPVLSLITPILHGLTTIAQGATSVVKAIGNLPGPIKDVLKVLGTITLGTGPLMMMIGIGANFAGTIGKFIAFIGLLGRNFKVLDEATAADNQLQQTALQTKDKAAQATASLSLRMKELVTIMTERMEMQEKLNASTVAAAEAEIKAADATAANAGAQNEVTAAEKESTAAQGTNVEGVLAQVTAWNELADAQRKAAAAAAEAAAASARPYNLNAATPTSVAGINGNGWEQVTNKNIAMLSATRGLDPATIAAMEGGLHGPLPFGTSGPAGTGFAVTGSGAAGYNTIPTAPIQWGSASSAAQASQRRLEALAKMEAAAAGTVGDKIFSAAEDGVTQALTGSQAQTIADAARAQNKRLVANLTTLEGRWLANFETMAAENAASVLGTPADYWKGVSTATNKDGFLPVSKYATTTAPSGPGVIPNLNTGGSFMPVSSFAQSTAQGGVTEEAVNNSAKVAANSEKAGIAWGKVAGNVGMLAIGGTMISAMAEGSGNIATNIMQSALAFSMIAPVVGQAVSKMGKLREEQALLNAEGVAGPGLMGASWTKLKSVAGNALSSLTSAARWLFLTGPGQFTLVVGLAAVALYTIGQQLSANLRQQNQINTSTKAWSDILGYQSKAQATMSDAAKSDASSWSARQKAVTQLASANQGLVDRLKDVKNASKEAGGGLDGVFNVALNEGLKVKVDGGSTQQAKMAFQVALQAAGVTDQDFKTLNAKFDTVNLDDPQGLADALNSQITAALNGIGPVENMDPGWIERFGNTFQKAIGQGADQQLSDDTLAKISAFANNSWDAINNAMQSGDKDKLKSTGDTMTKSLDQTFQSAFDNIRSQSPDNAKVFQHFGISTMDGLQKALNDAAAAKKPDEWQKKLLGIKDNIADDFGWTRYTDAFSTMLTDMGHAAGMTDAQIDAMKSKIKSGGDIASYFSDMMGTAASSTTKAGDAFQKAADGAASLGDALNTDGATVTASQITQEAQSAYSGTIQAYVQQMNTAWSQAQQAASDAIQKAGDAQVKGLQDQQKAQDAAYGDQDKAITQHYKDLGASYDKNIKAKQDETKAETDAIQTQIDALKKSDSTRQDLFNNEMTRMQRLAAAQTNNIDFNAALNSGNLNEAARLYANNQSQTQQNMLDDSQKAQDAASQAQQDAMSAQIQAINDARDAYVQAQQDKKDSLSDLEQAEHDAVSKAKQDYDDKTAASIAADQATTQASLKASSDKYAYEKAMIDQTVAAQTAFVPQTVGQTKDLISQVGTAYGQFGDTLTYFGKSWSGIIKTDLEDNISAAANKMKSDIAWSQLGTYIQQQMDAGASFTLDDALTFLKTGQFPTGTMASASQGLSSGHSWDMGGGQVGPGHAHGGEVPGPRFTGPGTKFQPAGIVHAGEFVFPQEAVQRIGLRNLNDMAFSALAKNGIAPGYAGGGLVTPAFGAGMAATKDAVLRAAVMRAAAQKIMDTAMIDEMTGDASGVVAAAASGVNGSQTWKALDKIRQALFPGSVLTDALRPGAKDYHGLGEAIDIGWPGNTQAGLMPIAARLAAMFPNSTELIHNPNGSIKNGRAVPASFWGASTWAQHANHVHWAMTPQALSQIGMGNMIGASVAPTSLTGNQAIVQQIAAQYGWNAGAEWNSLFSLINKESGFRNTAQNPTSTAYGMFQFLDSTWKNYGMAKTSDPTKQAQAGMSYLKGRYGDPIHAWAHELQYNWYDNGGMLKPGQVGLNGTGKPEPVFTDAQWSIMKSLVGSSVNNLSAAAGGIDSGSGKAYNIEKVNIDMTGALITGQVDFEEGVYNALVKLDDKMGRSRTVS